MTKMKMNWLAFISLLTILGGAGRTVAMKNLQQKVDISDFAALLLKRNTNKSELFDNSSTGSFSVTLASSGFYTGPYIQVSGDITLWNRHVEYSDYSINVVGCWKRNSDKQIAVMLLAGYGVYPSIFGDNKNRLFIASNVYNRNCINDAACLGFVPIPSKYKMGDIIEDVSGYGDPNNQKVLKVSIRKEEDKWFILYNDIKIGYIKNEAMSYVKDCDEIGWGGMVGITGTAGSPTGMGNGFFPSEGYSRSGAIAAAYGIKTDGSIGTGREYLVTSDKPECYDIKVNDDRNVASDYNFLYGGPGC